MKRILSAITAIFLIYGILEIKSLMEDKKTISLLERTFNRPKKEDPGRRATIIIKKESSKKLD